MCRYGGEECLAVLPNTDLDAAVTVAERVRAAVAGSPVPGRAQRLAVTVSAGVASSVPPADEAEALLQRADEALYAAKRAGRNRVHHQRADSTVPAAAVHDVATG